VTAYDQEESREAARVGRGRDQAADRGAEADAEVHADALERVGGVPVVCRRQARQERGLAGPEAGGARALEPEEREGVPRLADEREQCERDSLQQQSEQQRVAAADPVDDRPRSPARSQRGSPAEREREPGLGERDPTHVVQVDDDEREHDPIAERVDHPAGLDEPDLPRKMWVEPAEVRDHHYGSARGAVISTHGPRPCVRLKRPVDAIEVITNAVF
jgi:hypothetical protein